MKKSIVTGVSLTEQHLSIIDMWADSTELSRSEAVRILIEHHANDKIVKDGFSWKIVKGNDKA